MCEPTTLLIASAVVTSLGQVASGVQAAGAAKYRADIANQNMQIERAAARDALERGRQEEQRQYTRNAQRQGEIRAAQAANGLEVDFGTNADVQDDAKRIGLEDAATVRENARRESRGYDIRAWNSQADAAAAKGEAKAAIWSTVFDVGSTMLSSASQFGKMNAAKSAGAGARAGSGIRSGYNSYMGV